MLQRKYYFPSRLDATYTTLVNSQGATMKKPSLTSLDNFLFCSHTQMCHRLLPPSCSSIRESIHYLWCHVVGDAEGQVLQDALHAVVMLLAGGAKVLLQSSCHGGEDGLGCFSGVHHLSWCLLLLLCLEAFDVSESLFYCNHKPAAKKSGQQES